MPNAGSTRMKTVVNMASKDLSRLTNSYVQPGFIFQAHLRPDCIPPAGPQRRHKCMRGASQARLPGQPIMLMVLDTMSLSPYGFHSPTAPPPPSPPTLLSLTPHSSALYPSAPSTVASCPTGAASACFFNQTYSEDSSFFVTLHGILSCSIVQLQGTRVAALSVRASVLCCLFYCLLGFKSYYFPLSLSLEPPG